MGKYAVEEDLSHLCISVFYLMMVEWNDGKNVVGK